MRRRRGRQGAPPCKEAIRKEKKKKVKKFLEMMRATYLEQRSSAG
jgi:hypothetical protein